MDNGHMDIAQLILRDPEWKDALCNDNRWKDEVNDPEYDTPMRKVSDVYLTTDVKIPSAMITNGRMKSMIQNMIHP